MSNYSFTVTQIVYGFTATIAQPAELVLTDPGDVVQVTNSISTITQTSTVFSVIVSGAGTGQSFDQSLNTTDDVAFNSITTNNIYGTSPITFFNGINLTNVGTTFIGDIDMGGVVTQFTNQLALLFALLPLDFGYVNLPAPFSVDMGGI